MAKKPQHDEAADAADDIIPTAPLPCVAPNALEVRFMGDPSEPGERAPATFTAFGRTFKTGEWTDVSDMPASVQARFIGNSHFETTADDEGKRERLGARAARGKAHAKAVHKQKLKAEAKANKLVDDIETESGE